MLDLAEISAIVRDVTARNFASKTVEAVSTETATDSEGRDALRITIILASGAARKLKGDAVLDTLVDIQDRLRAAGEERFAIVEYATEDELAASGSSEP